MARRQDLALALLGCCVWAAPRFAQGTKLPEDCLAFLQEPRCYTPHGFVTLRTVRWGQRLEQTVEVSCRGDRVIFQPKGADALMRQGGRLWRIDAHGRLVLLDAASLSRRWLGSDFTPADLLGGDHWARDYVATVTFAGIHDGVEISEVILAASTGAAAWGKVVVEFRRDTAVAQQIHYYDHQGMLARRQVLRDLRPMHGHPRPMALHMQDVGETASSYSEWVYDDPKAAGHGAGWAPVAP